MKRPCPIIPPGLAHCRLYHLEACMRIVLARAEERSASRLSLTLRESMILRAASSQPSFSQGAIADCLGVNRNVMVLEIDGLEKRGYLKRERKRDNRREQAIVLTAKGRRVTAIIEKMQAKLELDLLRPATAKERATLIRWCRAVIEGQGTRR